MKKMYMVRSKSIGGYRSEIRFEKFLERGVVAIGWSALGDLNRFKSQEEIREERLKTKPGLSMASAAQHAGNLYLFSRELLESDFVITYDPRPTQKLYAVGKIAGEYTYAPEFFDFEEDNFPNLIRVDWNPVRFSRRQLSCSAKKALGLRHTVFQVKDEAVIGEILGLVQHGWE